jgi:arsenate reductase (thioredoxin)
VHISRHTGNLIDDYRDESFGICMTLCSHAASNCATFHNAVRHIHEYFDDPAKTDGTEVELISEFRSIQNEIKAFCRKFISEYLAQNPDPDSPLSDIQ